MEDRISSDINDFLIVQKIHIYDENIEEDILDTHTEEKLLAEDYEVIVKKQLQILQADERGRRAYSKEIAKNKKLLEERCEVLNAKKQALENERERAQRIASLPPPLPRSVKSLLKEMGKKETALSEKTEKDEESSEFKGIQGTNICSRKKLKLISNSENKENMLNDYEKREKDRLEAERDMKAQLRFNEALKKDRLKQECTLTLKQIHNAEQANRRQQAKFISVKGGTVPCPFSDKLGISEKQSQMENAVESICKNTKEHAIEDLEGYEDQLYYENIISDKKNQMIDCVPKFVKENYSYLLEDESEYQCGKRFSGLDESFDELNMAYIESPVERTPSVEIDAVISQLDKMRAETNEVYQREFKPLLEKGELKKSLIDKSIATDILKQPTEHKSIDNCHVFLHKKLPSTSQSVQVDLFKDSVTDHYERGTGSNIEPHKNILKESLPRPEFALEQLIPEIQIKWRSPTSDHYSSSTSYMSLPSNHGIPDICTFYDHSKQKFPTTREAQKDCIPLSKAPEGNGFIPKSPETKIITISEDEELSSQSLSEKDLAEPPKKLYLSSLIKQVADKYLKNKHSPSTSVYDKSEGLDDSKIKRKTFAQREEEFNQPTDKVLHYLDDKVILTDHSCGSLSSELSSKPENKLIKEGSQEGLSGFSHSVDRLVPSEESKQIIASNDEKNVASAKRHEYHELSTIPEIDSALANDTIPSFLLPDSFSSKKSTTDKVEKMQRNSHLESPSVIAKSKTSAEILVKPQKVAEVFAPSISSQSQPQTPTLSPSLCTASVSKVSDLSNLSTPFSVKSENSFSSSSSDFQRTPYSSSFQNFQKRPPYLTNIDSLPKFFEDISSIKQTGRAVKYHGGFETSHFPSKHSEVESASWGEQNKVPKYKTPIADDNEKLFLQQSSAKSFKMLTPLSYVSSVSEETIVEDESSIKKFSVEKLRKENPVHLIKPSQSSNSSLGNFESLVPVSYLSTPKQSRKSPSITISEHISIPTKFSHTNDAKYIAVDKKESGAKSPEGRSNLISESSSSKQQKNFRVLKEHKQIDSLASVTLHSSISLPHSNQTQLSGEKSDSEQSFKFLSPVSYLSTPRDHSAETGRQSVVTPVTLHKTPTTEAWKYAPGTYDDNSSSSQQLFDYHFVAGDNLQLPQLKSFFPKHMAKPIVKTSNSSIRKGILEQSKDFKIPAQVCKSDFFVPSANQDLAQLLKSVNEPQFKISAQSKVPSYNEINDRADLQIFDPTKGPSPQEMVLSKHRVHLETPTSSDSSQCSFAFPSSLKETFQSTPVKSFEEILQEPGIMEEPELTLLNQITIRPSSPDKSKAFAPESTDSVHKTASGLFAPSPHHCDSPSMMSFLQHEMSCFSNANTEVLPVFTDVKTSSVPKTVLKKLSPVFSSQSLLPKAVHKKTSPGSQETVPKTTQKKCFPSKKTPGKEYKSRTKRLWENLEEVKSRKNMEARKEELLKNKQKMKAYAKRVTTPKRKI